MLCSLSLYKAIKKKYPACHITLVAAKTNYEIPFFDINPHIDRVLIYDKSSLKTILKFYNQLRDRKYKIGFVPSTIVLSRTSHIINYLSGAKKRVGVNSIDNKKNKVAYLLNVKKDFYWKGKHQLKRNLEIAEIANFSLSEKELSEIKIEYKEADINFAKTFIEKVFPDRTKKIIAFHPGAGKVSNTWSSDKFIELIKKIYVQYNNYILITSGWTDDIIVQKIKDELNKSSIKYEVLNNAPIKNLGAILAMVDLYITNDTGTMHIAGYSGAKLIALFGPTDPNEWAPITMTSHYIKSVSDNINEIFVDEVFKLAKNILNGSNL